LYLTGYVIVPNAVFNNTNKGNGTYGQCDRILTAEECHSAGQQLTNNASIFFDTENLGDEPSGCYLFWQNELHVVCEKFVGKQCLDRWKPLMPKKIWVGLISMTTS